MTTELNPNAILQTLERIIKETPPADKATSIARDLEAAKLALELLNISKMPSNLPLSIEPDPKPAEDGPPMYLLYAGRYMISDIPLEMPSLLMFATGLAEGIHLQRQANKLDSLTDLMEHGAQQ